MKALTLTQPYASLVVHGHKHIETRSWSTRYRGPLAIHAAKSWPEEDQQWQSVDPHFRDALREIGELSIPGSLPRGAVIGVVNLVGCHLMLGVSDADSVEEGSVIYVPNPVDRSQSTAILLTPKERAFGSYDEGRYAWMLEDPQTFTPQPARGSLSLWDWTPPWKDDARV